MGSPVINRTNVWGVYRELLHRCRTLNHAPEQFERWEQVVTASQDEDTVDLLPELEELPMGMDSVRADGSYYMGGVNNGQGLGKS